MFGSSEELCDVVSILPYSPEDDVFFLVHDDRSPGYWIPSQKSFSSGQWKNTARELLDCFFTDGEVENVCKLVRIWNPQGKGEIHHVVYVVNVLKQNKKVEVINQKLRVIWASVEEVLQNYSRLRSPELMDYISGAIHKRQLLPEKKVTSLNPEGCWSKLIDDRPLNIVVEILEKQVFPDIQFTAHQKLLDSANFSRRIQIGIFAHFLVNCFPCTYMNLSTFSKMVQKLGWDDKGAAKLFHTADVNAMGFLSYRDFLYLLAVMEPKTLHGDKAWDLRSQYIFRQYDRNNDKVLDQSELRNLADDVLRMKRITCLRTYSDVCPLLNSGGSDFVANLKSFQDLIGNQKLRGTSMLLRSTASIPDVFPPLSEDIKFVKFVPESTGAGSALATRVVTFFPGASETSLTTSGRAEPSKNYEVEIHCVKLTEHGTVVDIDRVNGGDRGEEASGTEARGEYAAAQAEVLRLVHFFACALGPGEARAPGLLGPKRAFSWGTVDPATIVPSLLKVCEGATALLRAEPRLVELRPPVCALGALHGSLPDLLLVERAFWNLGPALSPTALLFLGDYVDRGQHGLEVIAHLLARKLQCPSKLALLRGSREVRVVQQAFFGECAAKLGAAAGRGVWAAVNAALDCLPLAAVVGGRVFCSHGGVPPPWLCPVTAAINAVPCPLPRPDEQSPLAWELMWNEPLARADAGDWLQAELDAKEGFAVNPVKGTGHLFSAAALDRFLRGNGLSLFLRAHDRPDADFPVELRRLMLTLHSARDAPRRRDATCMLVYVGKDRHKQAD